MCVCGKSIQFLMRILTKLKISTEYSIRVDTGIVHFIIALDWALTAITIGYRRAEWIICIKINKNH